MTPLWLPRGEQAECAAAAPFEASLPGRPETEAVRSDRSARTARARIARMDWPALKEAVRSCTACPLHATRKQTVFGVGDEQADWLFVGEGPGAEEDARGEPFVGQAGKLLDNMLAVDRAQARARRLSSPTS